MCLRGPRNLGVFRLKSGYRSNSKEGIQLFDRNISSFFVHYEIHQFPGAAGVVLSPEISCEILIPDFGGDLTGKVDATAVIDKNHISRTHLVPTQFIHRSGDCSPHDEVGSVVNLFQVVNFLWWQECPNLIESSFALNRILEVPLCRRIPASDYQEDLS